jgi:hypothetical protein
MTNLERSLTMRKIERSEGSSDYSFEAMLASPVLPRHSSRADLEHVMAILDDAGQADVDLDQFEAELLADYAAWGEQFEVRARDALVARFGRKIPETVTPEIVEYLVETGVFEGSRELLERNMILQAIKLRRRRDN